MSSFCNAKATHIFSAKNINVFAIFQDINSNVTLANNLLSFEQMGPGHFGPLSRRGLVSGKLNSRSQKLCPMIKFGDSTGNLYWLLSFFMQS